MDGITHIVRRSKARILVVTDPQAIANAERAWPDLAFAPTAEEAAVGADGGAGVLSPQGALYGRLEEVSDRGDEGARKSGSCRCEHARVGRDAAQSVISLPIAASGEPAGAGAAPRPHPDEDVP